MKRFASIILTASTLLTGFVPAYIVDKYTQRRADGTFVHRFGVVAETASNRTAATVAQQKFAHTFRLQY